MSAEIRRPLDTPKAARPSRRNSAWVRWLLGAGFVFAGLAVVSWIAVPKHPSLLDRATPVPAFRTNVDIPLNLGCSSDGQIVYLDARSRGSTLVRIDLRTGVVKELQTGLRYASTPTSQIFKQPEGTSPDGRHALFTELKIGSAYQDHFLFDTGTMRFWKLLTTLHSTPAWAPDGKSFALREWDKLIVTRVPEGTTRTHQISVPARIQWFDGEDRVVSSNYNVQQTTSRDFYETSLKTGKTNVLPLLPPKGAEITWFELSPTKDRVLWWVAWRNVKPTWFERAMATIRLKPLPGSQQSGYEGVLISKPDGSDMRELGRLKLEYAPDGLGAVKWMPDGKRIVIQYRRGLYIVPVD
jgi:hypothetical protein